MAYPEDKEIIKKFVEVQDKYPDKSDNWNLRITADEMKCPISYIRSVLEEAYEKGDI